MTVSDDDETRRASRRTTTDTYGTPEEPSSLSETSDHFLMSGSLELRGRGFETDSLRCLVAAYTASGPFRMKRLRSRNRPLLSALRVLRGLTTAERPKNRESEEDFRKPRNRPRLSIKTSLNESLFSSTFLFECRFRFNVCRV